MSERKRAPGFDWVLWLQWILATTLGWFVGLALHEAAVGLVIGFFQWLILRQRVRRAEWWLPASALGWLVGWLLLLVGLSPDVGVVAFAALGSVLGGAQWLVLRRWAHQTGWWVVTSALGWAAGPIFGPALVGAVVGAITGITIELHMRAPLPEARKQPAAERLCGDRSAKDR